MHSCSDVHYVYTVQEVSIQDTQSHNKCKNFMLKCTNEHNPALQAILNVFSR